MFWLSHHHSDELDRCYKIGTLHICARCLGTYPVMFAAIILQFAMHAPLHHELDIPLATGLIVPATVDWAYGRFRPHAGSNLFRTLTGVLLGLGMARSLFIHLQKPFPAVLLIQMLVVLAVGLPVFFTTYRRPRQ